MRTEEIVSVLEKYDFYDSPEDRTPKRHPFGRKIEIARAMRLNPYVKKEGDLWGLASWSLDDPRRNPRK